MIGGSGAGALPALSRLLPDQSLALGTLGLLLPLCAHCGLAQHRAICLA